MYTQIASKRLNVIVADNILKLPFDRNDGDIQGQK